MKYPSVAEPCDTEGKVFNIENEEMQAGAWWWWFWLFFFKNPVNPKKPRQLMVLWSVKNVPEIDCNHLNVRAKNNGDRSSLDGVVAAWYFDGVKMNHNYLLEQCKLDLTEKQLTSYSSPKTSFSIDKGINKIKIGEDMSFTAEETGTNIFTRPTYNEDTYLANMGYSVIRTNFLTLKGRIKNEEIDGSAYFQRVFVNAPVVPWYWGIFHFENGAVLSYFNPYLFGKSFKKDVSFYDGKQMHRLSDLKIKRAGRELPTFIARAENKDEIIEFTVTAYSHSPWIFKRKALEIVPTKLNYNEYPATITRLTFTNKRTGERMTMDDLGTSMGNAEHTTGLLL